jgi:hypothetical protein
MKQTFLPSSSKIFLIAKASDVLPVPPKYILPIHIVNIFFFSILFFILKKFISLNKKDNGKSSNAKKFGLGLSQNLGFFSFIFN